MPPNISALFEANVDCIREFDGFILGKSVFNFLSVPTIALSGTHSKSSLILGCRFGPDGSLMMISSQYDGCSVVTIRAIFSESPSPSPTHPLPVARRWQACHRRQTQDARPVLMITDTAGPVRVPPAGSDAGMVTVIHHRGASVHI